MATLGNSSASPLKRALDEMLTTGERRAEFDAQAVTRLRHLA